MNIFDSQKKRKWEAGKGQEIFLPATFGPKDYCSTKFFASKPNKIRFVAKKRSGNGWVVIEAFDGLGRILADKKIKLSSKLSKEFSLDLPGESSGELCLRISRPRTAVGSITIERVVVSGSDFQAPVESQSNGSFSRKTRPVDYRALTKGLAKRASLGIIIPYGIYGGAEVYIERLISSGHQDLDIDVICINQNKIYNNLLNTNINVYKKDNIPALRSFLTSKDYDNIVYYNSKRVYKNLIKLKASGLIGSRLIEIFHSRFIWPDALASLRTRTLVDAVIRVSSSLVDDVAGLEGVRKTTIPVPVDISEFDVEASGVDISSSKYIKVFGMVARLSSEKNINYALNLFKRLPNYKLVILGDGPLRPILESRIKEEELSNVDMLGHIDDIAIYYKSFDAFILTSKIEGSPISIVEAMASGLPVFTAPVGEIAFNYSDAPGVNFLTLTEDSDIKMLKDFDFEAHNPGQSTDFILKNNHLPHCRELFFSSILNRLDCIPADPNSAVLPGSYI